MQSLFGAARIRTQDLLVPSPTLYNYAIPSRIFSLCGLQFAEPRGAVCNVNTAYTLHVFEWSGYARYRTTRYERAFCCVPCVTVETGLCRMRCVERVTTP